MNKKIITIGILILLFSLSLCGCITQDNQYEKINIIGETAVNGVYDPSIEYDQNGTGWMTYSPVEAPEYAHTHLAKSTDHGKTWSYVQTINQAKNGTIILDNETLLKGVWRHEVSTLVNDPNDSGKEWKVYWHKYFTIPPYELENRLFQYGWIAYKYAPHPTGPWSEETLLFGAGIFPLEPYETTIDLSSLHEDLNEFVCYSEPGSIVLDDILYLSLNGHVIIDGQNIGKTILISSVDHGDTWHYVNTLLEPEDVKEYGGLYFSGSSLVEEEDRIFLFACPDNPNHKLKNHLGTCIYEFEDITKGILKRDENEELTIHKYLKTTLISGGQSDYDEQNTYGGIIMPQHNYSALPELFQIFNTKEKIISNQTHKPIYN